MAESYTLILNSALNTNRTGDANNSTYAINWDSFLPPNVSKFALSVSIRSILTATALTTTAIVNIDGLGLYCMDQSGSRSSACLAIIPATNGGVSPNYSYQSLYSDDNSILVDRPASSNKITVRWTSLTGVELTTVPNNLCYLNFTPIS